MIKNDFIKSLKGLEKKFAAEAVDAYIDSSTVDISRAVSAALLRCEASVRILREKLEKEVQNEQAHQKEAGQKPKPRRPLGGGRLYRG